MGEERHNFYIDLDLVVKSLLKKYNIKYSNNKRTDELLLDYLTILKKLISTIPREVLISPLLKSKLEESPKQKEVKHIKVLLEKGKNVNFFQSETLFQSKKHDHLSYEWNIFHFHLSLKRQNGSNFMERSKAILFAYITDKKAILLDIKNHSRKEKGIFADTYWVEILHDYFLNEIEKFQHTFDMPDSNKLNYSSEERLNLWEKGFSPFIYNVRGVTYGSPGTGRMISGHPINIVRQQNEIIRWVYYADEVFSTYEKEMKKRLNLDKWKIQLTVTEYGFSIVEHYSEQILLVYPNIFNDFAIY